MILDKDRFMEEGYLVLRNVIPPDRLASLRAAYETLVDRQRAIWAQSPSGNVWEISPQPRLALDLTPELIDDKTANTVECWLDDNTLGVSQELLAAPDAGVTQMMLMCNPVRDHGPANWHRDVHPIDTAPLEAYLLDLAENGPRYVQWNISLYDDDVLWVVPGSHLRINTEAEDRSILADPKAPVPGGVQTHLKGGDGVVYILPILHWGSNYSTQLRRTIHGGYSNYTAYSNLAFVHHLSPESRAAFERWAARTERMKDHTEAALRAVIRRDGPAYLEALDRIHPGRGEQGKRLSTVYLCKAAFFIYLAKHPGLEDIPAPLHHAAKGGHPGTLNWGPDFAGRFSVEEADTLWQRFEIVDRRLQADEPFFEPGFQSGPMRYFFNRMPDELTVDRFIAGWGA
ncbi:MAG: phytanoyl-CoA dioxygenase family protein [candidate division Zixibacteria bacterium]|nr:phytanoyl-CoA dioxygenase family protein [candidate division Zixibacteria bacterium]